METIKIEFKLQNIKLHNTQYTCLKAIKILSYTFQMSWNNQNRLQNSMYSISIVWKLQNIIVYNGSIQSFQDLNIQSVETIRYIILQQSI